MSIKVEINLIEKFSLFIKEKREAKGWSQKDLSIKAFGDDKKQQWISAIELGRPITILTLEKILEALDSDISIIEY